MRRCLWICVIVIGLVAMSEVSAGMFGFFKRYDVLLSPEVQGQITLDGKPLQGVKILREITYDDAEVEAVYTDKDGRFRLNRLSTRSSTPGKAFSEARIRQILLAEYQDKKYVLWYYVTGRITGEVVIQEKLAALNCDLLDEEKDHHFVKQENPEFTHNISSICRW